MRLFDSIRLEYYEACGLAGYIRNRLLEKSTWIAISGAVLAANSLKPLYAAMTIVVALVVALLPSPGTNLINTANVIADNNKE